MRKVFKFQDCEIFLYFPFLVEKNREKSEKMSRFLLQAALRPKIVTIARPISLTVPVQNYKMKEHFVRLGIEPGAVLSVFRP